MSGPSSHSCADFTQQPLFASKADYFVDAVAEHLHPNHLADLRASGLHDATIAAHGFQTIYDPEIVKTTLNWSSVERAAELGPCLEIPFFDAAGKRTAFSRLKPLTPREAESDGKVRSVKYEQPMRVGSRAYFPLGLSEALRRGERIALTEGEKKALALTQEGPPTIGLTGIWNWTKKRIEKSAPRQLIDDLSAVDWRREVLIIIDGDEQRNANVQYAATTLAAVLADRGAHPVLVPLSPFRG